jgi:hypothetical protein
MRDAPLGRETAWHRLVGRLEARQAALILIAGRPGSGRTHLLRAVGEAATTLGYTVIGRDEPVALEPTTRLSDLQRMLAALVGRSNESEAESEQGKVTGRLGEVLDTAAKHAGDERAVFELLEAAVPVVLAIDGFAPSATMATWFASRLMPYILALPLPIVVLVADQLESMTALRNAAAEVIELGPLDHEEVGRRLRAVGADLEPPLSDDELAVYCAAAADDLSLLTPLEEVLSMLGTKQ